MKIKSLRLNRYKRFHDLTIDLGDSPPRIVALVGPNGCGKSSVFDGLLFLQNAHEHIGETASLDHRYHSLSQEPGYQHTDVEVEFTSGNFSNIFARKRESGQQKTIFSFRSSYRYNSEVKIADIRAIDEITDNSYGTSTANALDQKMIANYRRLLAKYSKYRDDKDIKPSEARLYIIGELNKSLEKCLELVIEDIGDVESNRGTIFFRKLDHPKTFDFNVLSSGEKEVVDIILDLFLRKENYNDSIFLIDEPELHINTSIQRKLLEEINSLIGENCQIWLATHSIGFLRALQEDLGEECEIIRFDSGVKLASETCKMVPMTKSRANWVNIFEVALDDLVGLVAPKRIIYCEGKAEAKHGGEFGLDAQVYNAIFGETYHDTLFVSSGGNTELEQRREIAITVLEKALSDIEILVLKDRDFASGASTGEIDRQVYLANNPQHHRVLRRWEIENYLYDRNVLMRYCSNMSLPFDEEGYNRTIVDVENDDVKNLTGQIKRICGILGNIGVEQFKLQLAQCICPGMDVYQELKECIFERK